MGLAASQARLLSLTSRIHDVEFEAQQVQYAKMRLALMEDEVSKKYMEALDAETLTMTSSTGAKVKATFDNLCGLSSINNNLGTTAHYVFRDSTDSLLVPHDVYQGYLSYGGSDPYEFGMYMLGIDLNDQTVRYDYDNAMSSITNSENETLDDIKEKILKSEGFQKLFDKSSENTNPNSAYNTITDANKKEERKQEKLNEIFDAILSNSSLSEIFEDGKIPDDVKDIIENVKKSVDEYKFGIYKKGNYKGAEAIFNASKTSNENFDSKKFDYYVRWGQLIQKEGGIDGSGDDLYLSGCQDASIANDGVENNAILLNQYIMSGLITIDVVYDDRKGGISETMTTPAVDTILNMDKESTVDSTAVKKAELEYNTKMKEINRIDKNYDLTLNRLETERTALTTEYDSVKKVISDNIERSFGIFS